MSNEIVLRTMLEIAVPLWQVKVKNNFDYYAEKKKEYTDIIASKADIILYKSPRKGESASAFNTLACAVAVLSFSPGGIDIFGLHFEAIND